MFFQDAQPPNPPAAVHVLHTEAHFVTAAARDTPLVLTRAHRMENAVVRHQVYIESTVEVRAPDNASAECVWTLSSHLQRQICFTSMTGLFACADIALADQADSQNGHSQLTSSDDVTACGLANLALVDAENKLSQVLGATSQARFDADLKLKVTPMLVRAGAAVKRGG
jgi:hypothetical protein